VGCRSRHGRTGYGRASDVGVQTWRSGLRRQEPRTRVAVVGPTRGFVCALGPHKGVRFFFCILALLGFIFTKYTLFSFISKIDSHLGAITIDAELQRVGAN
jgi:hypothetical protein